MFDIFQLHALQRQHNKLSAELSLARRQAHLSRQQSWHAAKQQLSKPEALGVSFTVGVLSGLQPTRQRMNWLARLQPFVTTWLQQQWLQPQETGNTDGESQSPKQQEEA